MPSGRSFAAHKNIMAFTAAVIAMFNFSGRIEAASGLPMDEIPAEADLPIARPDGRPGRPGREVPTELAG